MITSKNVQYCVESSRKGEDVLVLDHELNANVMKFLQIDFRVLVNTSNYEVIWDYAVNILRNVPDLVSDVAEDLTKVQEAVSNLLIDTWNCKIDCNTWPDVFDLHKFCIHEFASQVLDCLIQISQQQR